MLVLWREWGLDVVLREASKERFFVESAPDRFVGLNKVSAILSPLENCGR